MQPFEDRPFPPKRKGQFHGYPEETVKLYYLLLRQGDRLYRFSSCLPRVTTHASKRWSLGDWLYEMIMQGAEGGLDTYCGAFEYEKNCFSWQGQAECHDEAG